MRAKLKLVVSNDDVNDKIIASIRPLDREVAPSERFREGMKLRLLKLEKPIHERPSRAA
jgi:hypothetical protein